MRPQNQLKATQNTYDLYFSPPVIVISLFPSLFRCTGECATQRHHFTDQETEAVAESRTACA
jgi:hypothetical protein